MGKKKSKKPMMTETVEPVPKPEKTLRVKLDGDEVVVENIVAQVEEEPIDISAATETEQPSEKSDFSFVQMFKGLLLRAIILYIIMTLVKKKPQDYFMNTKPTNLEWENATLGDKFTFGDSASVINGEL